jgi:molybdopterin converting factor small subunit
MMIRVKFLAYFRDVFGTKETTLFFFAQITETEKL